MRRVGSLIAFTILLEWGAGVFLVSRISGLSDDGAGEIVSLASGALTMLAALSALLHLGRPSLFWKALRNWRTSPLSREVIGAFAFQLCWTLWAATSPRWAPASPATSVIHLSAGWSAAILGLLTIWSVGRLYMATFIPSWRREATWVEHVATALALGGTTLSAAVVFEGFHLSSLAFASGVALAASLVALLGIPGLVVALASSARAASMLAHQRPRALPAWIGARAALGLVQCGLVAWLFASGVHATPGQAALALAGVLASETLARTLFYRLADPLLP